MADCGFEKYVDPLVHKVVALKCVCREMILCNVLMYCYRVKDLFSRVNKMEKSGKFVDLSYFVTRIVTEWNVYEVEAFTWWV